MSIEKVYYDPEKGYSGVQDIAKKTKLPKKDVKEFLHTQETYTLHKPIRKTFPRRRVWSPDIDNQWQADLVVIQKFKSFNENTNYILTVIDVFSKYAWALPIKKKTGEEITKAFKDIFKERKPNLLHTDKGTEFINKQTQKILEDNKIKWFATESELKAQIVERFNRTLKTKMWKYFTANNTKKWIDVLDKLVYNYNNSYHRSIKMSPVEASKEKNKKIVYYNLYGFKGVNPYKRKFEIGDRVRITKERKEFRKGYLPNFTTEIFVVSEELNTVPWTYKIKDLSGEEITGSFYEPEMVKFNKPDDVYKIEKIIKTKGDKMYVKWLGYPDKFNSWIEKKDIQEI